MGSMIGLQYVFCADAAVPALQAASATIKALRGLMDLPPLHNPMRLTVDAG